MTKYMILSGYETLYSSLEEVEQAVGEMSAGLTLNPANSAIAVVAVDGVKTYRHVAPPLAVEEGVDFSGFDRKSAQIHDMRVAQKAASHFANLRDAAVVGEGRIIQEAEEESPLADVDDETLSTDIATLADNIISRAESPPYAREDVSEGDIAEEAETLTSESETPGAGHPLRDLTADRVERASQNDGVFMSDQDADPLDETGAV